MPWRIEQKDGKYCVVKESDGKSAGCHDSRADAIKQQRALYASERKKAGGAAVVTLRGEVEGDDLVVRSGDKEVARKSLAAVQVVDTPDDEAVRWEGPLALEGVITSDRRYIPPGQMTERDLPLPLNAQLMTGEAHANSVNVGRIETIRRFPVGEMADREAFGLAETPEEAIVIWGEGTFDDTDAAAEAQRMMRNGAGVSLDMALERFAPIDPDTLLEVDEADVDMEKALAGEYLGGLIGKIAGATVVTIPAFEEAAIRLAEREAMVASGGMLRVVGEEIAETFTRRAANIYTRSGLMPFVASAQAFSNDIPPREWFDNPDLDRPTPLTVDNDGRIYGHLALWDSCHIGYSGVCKSPPESRANYAYFNTGLIETSDGTVPVGKLMFCREGSKHAPLEANAAAASRHYDDNSQVGGYVRAGSDQHGIWLAGIVKPGLSDDDIAYLRLNPPSGDWRPINGNAELVAAFAVPVPGLPIPHAEMRLVASGEVDEIAALIIGPLTEVPAAPVSRSHRRKLRMLSDRAHNR